MIALAFSVFLWRKCSEGIAPTRYMTYMHAWVALFTIPTVFILRQFNVSDGPFTPSWKQAAFVGLSLAVGTLGDYAFSFSQKFSSFSLNALIAPSSAIFSSLFAWAFASQALNTIQIGGMFLVVVSIAIASRINSNVRVETTINQEFDDELYDEMIKIREKEIAQSSIRDAPSKPKKIRAA
jgi:drug/metabolite transporter (DMT)-like permease